jgi:predicted lysophospholipase L1 biosynthesis ABC-type transport system permease subunit
VLRVASAVGDVTRAVKATAASVNPGIDLEFRVLTEQLNQSLTRDRLMAALAGGFGLLAGVLATLGLYGVIAYMVARRRNEIGVRIALGAGRGQVVRLVLRETAVLVAVGLAIGTGLAIWAAVLPRRCCSDSPYDPVTLAAPPRCLPQSRWWPATVRRRFRLSPCKPREE